MSTEPVLTRSSLRTWDIWVVLFLCSAGLTWSALLISQDKSGIAFLVLLTVLTIAFTIILVWKRRIASRQWVQDLGDGWMFIDPVSERRIDDSQVLGITFGVIKNFENGLFVSVTRKLSLWFESPGHQPECAHMINTMRVGAPDPLDNLIRRLSTRLLENARVDLAAGRSVNGQEWTLNSKSLGVRSKIGPTRLLLSEMAAADEVDGHVCIWRRDEDTASIRIPIESINAWLLLRLLEECRADGENRE